MKYPNSDYTIDPVSQAQYYVLQDGRLWHNVEGEFPELISRLSVPYECSSCGGIVLFEERLVQVMNGLLLCPYCGTRGIVDDSDILPPWITKEK